MREGKYIAVIVVLGYFVRELWTVLPKGVELHPFPLSGQAIQLQSYIWIATIYLWYLIFTFIAYRLSTTFKVFFEAVFIVQLAEFVEFFLNYNHHWGYIWIIPINVTTLRFPILIIALIVNLRKWKT